VQLGEDGLMVDPQLPGHWKRVRIPLLWRNRKLQFDIVCEPLTIQVELEGDDGVRLQLAGGPEVVMRAETKYKAHKSNGAWSEWLEVGV